MRPFFLLKIRRGDGYSVINPADDREYELNYSGCRILEQCDGISTVDDIVVTVAGEQMVPLAETRAFAVEFLETMTSLGMIAWRNEPVSAPGPWAPPATVFWDITDACNLRCRHCYAHENRRGDGELSTKEALQVLDEMSACGVESISISGGEPLLRKDFTRIISHAGVMGFKSVGVATNGTLMTPKIARLFREKGINVQVSIDGDRAETHDRLREVPGAFAQAMSGIRLLQREGNEVSVCTTVTPGNIDSIPRIIDLMGEIKVGSYRVQGVVTMGRGNLNRAELKLHPERMKELVAYLEKRNIPITSYNFTLKPPPEEPVDWCASGACSAGSSVCSITAGGVVVPCSYFWGLAGDTLREHSFQWIWRNSRLLNYFRSISLSDIRGACHDCPWLSQCHGGCKAENLVNGDLFSPSRSCWVADELEKPSVVGA